MIADEVASRGDVGPGVGETMPIFKNFVIDQFVVPALVMFFFLGGLVALAVALGLIFRSAGLFRLFEKMNRSVSMRPVTKPLEVPRNTGEFMFKHRRWIGSVFVVGALYAVYGILTGAGNATIVAKLKLGLPPLFVFWIIESVRYFLIVGCTISIIVGVLLVFSPETIRSLENRSAKWISTRQMARGADDMNLSFDKWVAAFPRVAGAIILFPALGTVIYFGGLLLRRA